MVVLIFRQIFILVPQFRVDNAAKVCINIL